MKNTLFLTIFSILFSAAAGLAAAQNLTITASLTPATTADKTDFFNPLIGNIFDDMDQIARSPLHLRVNDLYYIVPLSLAIGVSINNEVNFYNQLHNSRNDNLDQIMPYVTDMGDGLYDVSGLTLLYFLGSKDEKHTASISLEALADAGITGEFLKIVFGAPRPADSQGNRQFFDFNEAKLNGSFPSGHTASAFALAAVLGRSYHVEPLAYTLAAGVGYSRVYLGAHWPSDVIFGAALGTVIGNYIYDLRNNHPNGFAFSPGIREDGTPVLALKTQW